MAQIDSYLKRVRDVDGSDLHIASGETPKIRIHGKLTPLKEPAIPPERLSELLIEILDERRKGMYAKRNDLDMAYELPGIARFRVNLFRTRKGSAAVFRMIPEEVTQLEKLGVPMVVLKYAHLKNGLILVTGPTGSGKSTTLAAILDYINTNMKKHIVTIEEPIEFVHKNKKSFFTQREVGVDTESFAAALRACSREDPDVVLVGEMRDPETISLAITAAEMGYLVFATLHTNSAAKTVDRIIDVFPEEQQNQIRIMLSVTLKGVCAQQLLPKKDGKGRVPVNEILMGSTGLGNNIREGSIAKIVSLIETGRGEGMQLMDDSILQRYNEGTISSETAYLYAHQKQRFQHLAPKTA
ncbi:MAG TPA: type IV pilus twitching motility protein PilT [Planctomycetota bacterium]|jgi:twitching motility protein PilT|nr:type IV pilus twitching motility protein PilT [Planctomycetota bacterium]